MFDVEYPMIEFTSNDRCDRCGARAYSLARHDDFPEGLLFCIHHRKENYAKLLADGWEVIDDTEGLQLLADLEGLVI